MRMATTRTMLVAAMAAMMVMLMTLTTTTMALPTPVVSANGPAGRLVHRAAHHAAAPAHSSTSSSSPRTVVSLTDRSDEEMRAALDTSSSSSEMELMTADFVAWIKKHNAAYETAEFYHRSLVFFTHWKQVQRHNAEADAGLHTYRMGMTKFADRTHAEYRAMLKASARLGEKQDAAVPDVSGVSATFTSADAESMDVPASIDWRTRGVVTPIKDQGQCGSCWTFSATGNMESVHALASHELVSLSEQEWVDCLQNGTGCGGGWMNWVFEAAIAWGGAMSEASYPYVGTDGHACRFNASQTVASFASYMNVTEGDEKALTAATAVYPTISVAIDASHESFQMYQEGVYVEPECQNGVDDLDHAVLVVGYGVAAVNKTASMDYYWVKNSWGTSWGLDGYIQMARNLNNQCGIATRAMFVLV